MSKQYTIITFFILMCQQLFNQNPQVSWTLNNPLNGNITHQYVARDFILMNSGFSYDPTDNNNYFSADIDAHLIFPVDYIEEPILVNERTLDKGLPVGTTTGIQSVSLTGAANYQIPIVVPPGTADMEPGLSVVYSSQAGNGLLGMGWTLSGLSAITRVGKTYYHDGEKSGVNLDFNDRFVLDGSRLLAINGGTYGTNECVYYTEVFNGMKVTSIGSIGNGPQGFRVETKDGKTMEYGLTDNSRVKPGTTVLMWMVEKITDNYGNYISFYYTDYNGEKLINRVEYTANDDNNLSAYNNVEFYYSEREDINTHYVKDFALPMALLLDKVVIRAENEVVRTYDFNYQMGFYSHLAEVVEYNGLNEHYNSIVIENYPQPVEHFEDITSDPGPVYNELENHFFDFTGDGLTDLMRVDKYNHIATYWKRENNSFGGIPVGTDNLDASIQRIGLGDFNGDGLQDYIQFIHFGGEIKLVYSISSGNGEFEFLPEVAFTIHNYSWNETQYGFRSGDINGNGKTDFIVLYNPFSQEQNAWIKVFELDDNNIPQVIAENTRPYKRLYSKIHVADFNGDGKDDIMTFDYNGAQPCFLYSLTDNTNTALSEIYFGDFPSGLHEVFPGDFNGDGNVDILSVPIDIPSQWEVHYFNGTGFQTLGTPPDLPEWSQKQRYFTASINGDNKTDVVLVENLAAQIYPNLVHFYHFFAWYYSNGTSFTGYYNQNPYKIGEGSDISDGIYFYYTGQLPSINYPIDLNGDGHCDIHIYSRTEKIGNTEIFIKPFDKSNLIRATANGFNQKTIFNYSPLTDNTIYTKLGNAFSSYSNKVFDYQGGMYVVSAMETDNGNINERFKISYSYTGARIHRLGKGFLGFQGIEKTIYSNKDNLETVLSKTLSTFDNPTPYYKHFQIGASNYSGTNLISTETFENQNISSDDYGNSLIFIPFINKKTTYDVLKNHTITTVYDVDQWGNTIKTYTDFNGIGHQNIYSSFVKPDGSWVKSVPEYTIIDKVREEEDNYTRRTNYTYNNKGLLEYMISDPGMDKSITKYYTYDEFGNLQTETTSASGLESRLYAYEYDSKGRFAIKTTNPLGHEISSKFNSKFGQLVEESDQNGLVSTYEYDGFGRLTKSTYPDNSFSETKTHWYEGEKEDILYFVTQTPNFEPGVFVYFDLMGRERLTSSGTTVEGKRIFIETIYDKNGMVEKSSEPYLEGDTPKWNYYSYDNYFRVDYIDYRAFQIDYQYAGSTTSVVKKTTGGTVLSFSEKTMDAMGLMTTARDNGGTIQYTYESSGKPKEVSLGDVVTTMSYDEYGRQLTLFDPDAGLSSYEYNAFGELSQHEDANGNACEITYDMLGRIDTKNYVTGSTVGETYTYTYDNMPHGKGLLSSVESSNHTGSAYNYDEFGRLSKVTESIKDAAFETSYRYDNFSRLATMTYPSGYSINYSYNNGHLITIYDDDEVLNTIQKSNARGQIEQYVSGYTTTKKEYDTYGFPSKTKTTSNFSGGLGIVQELEYLFDAVKGNLYYRRDIKNGLSEYFLQYDDLNRIKASAVSSQPTINLTYNANGNIDSKSNVGKYIYCPTNKPHAVRKIENPVSSTSAFLEQEISYTEFNKVAQISRPELDRRISFTYGADEQRKKTEEFAKGEVIRTKFFVGEYYEQIIDERGNKKELNYVYGSDGLIAIVVVDKLATPVIQYFYIHQDYLGSYHTIVDRNANILETLSFDAWGNRRNPTDGSYINLPTTFLFDRGFTGHEHLDGFNVINMNGRIYDPILARFLSPDPFIQASNYTQNFNRYSYAFNNPMVYTDPDGNLIFIPILIGVVVYAAIDYGIQVGMNYANGYSGRDAWVNQVDFFDVAVSGVLGGLSGGYGYAAKTGMTLGKFGMAMANGSKLVQLGSVALTSAIDITGEGWKPVTFDQFGQRLAVAGIQYGVTKNLSKVFKGNKPSVNSEAKVDKAIDAAKTSAQGFKSVGAAGKGSSKTLQTGGHTLNKSTLKSLRLTKQQGKIAIEGLKKDIGLRPDFHGKIMGNGDFVHPNSGQVLGNLFDYLD